MLCLLWDPCALSSQEEAHQEQLGAPGTVGAFGAAGADGMLVAGLEAGLSQVLSLVSLL